MGGRKATTGSSFGLNCMQVQAAQMMAYGCTEEKILNDLFYINANSTPAEKAKAKRTLHKWMDLPGFGDCFRSEVKRCMTPVYGKAMQTIAAQLDSGLPWLANKAANDVLTRMAPVLGEEEKKIVVQVEGAPQLGTPDGDE